MCPEPGQQGEVIEGMRQGSPLLECARESPLGRAVSLSVLDVHSRMGRGQSPVLVRAVVEGCAREVRWQVPSDGMWARTAGWVGGRHLLRVRRYAPYPTLPRPVPCAKAAGSGSEGVPLGVERLGLS